MKKKLKNRSVFARSLEQRHFRHKVIKNKKRRTIEKYYNHQEASEVDLYAINSINEDLK